MRPIASVTTTVCLAWCLLYVVVGSTPWGKDWYKELSGKLFDDAKGGVPILTLALPIVISATTSILFLVMPPLREAKQRGLLSRRRGDSSMNWLAFSLVFLPCLAFLLATVQRHLAEKGDDATVEYKVAEIGNAFGKVATVALSFLLVPATRHGPLLALMGWSPAQFIKVHVWIGRIVSLSVFIHGGMHMYRWAMLMKEDLFGMLIPPVQCWGLVSHHGNYHDMGDGKDEQHGGHDGRSLHEGHHDDDHSGCRRGLIERMLHGDHSPEDDNGCGCRRLHGGHDNEGAEVACQLYQPTCVNPETECTCYHHFRNFTGLVAFLFLVVILLSSLGSVRRSRFSLFYNLHMISGPIVLFAAVLHYNQMILYICSGMLYYVSTAVPNWVQSWLCRLKDGGVRVTSAKEIPGSRQHCVAMTFEASPEALSQFRPGQYVRLCAPSISSVWHPFTVNIVPGQSGRMRILFRATGPFTKNLSEELLQCQKGGKTVVPTILIDGFHGPQMRVADALRHDVVALVAGGIGITPYLSLLRELGMALASSEGCTKSVILHWVCRDAKLIQFIKNEYLSPLINEFGGIGDGAFRVIVHSTCGDGTYSDSSEDNVTGGKDEGGNDEKENLEEVSKFPTVSLSGAGSAFIPTHFAPAIRTSVLANLPHFLTYACTAWVSLASIWYLYRHVQQKESHISSRMWGPVVALMISFSISIVANLVMDSTASVVWGKQSGRRKKVEFTPVANDDSQDGLELSEIGENVTEHHSVEMVGSALDAPSALVVGSDEGNQVTLKISKGRPSVEDLLCCLDGAADAGLFTCGPVAMMRQIRKAARSGYCGRGTALYEESFEM